jgi:hypothetical protein
MPSDVGQSTVKEHLNRIENLLRNMVSKMDAMDKKIDDLFDEDDPSFNSSDTSYTSEPKFEDFISEDIIYKKGRRIPYNKLIDRDEIADFRDMLKYILDNSDRFTEKEIDYAGFAAEKSEFPDVRISDNSRRILGTAYQKIHRKPWNFNFQRGYMHKYLNQIAWSWSDGTKD